MRKLYTLSFIAVVSLVIISCTKMGTSDGSSSSPSLSIAGPGSSGPGSGGGGTAGVITAGEWNDLAHWDFWNNLMANDTFSAFRTTWGFYLQHRVTVILKDASGKLIHDAKIKLSANGQTAWARTNNDGKAELFASIYQPGFTPGNYTLTAEYLGQTFNLGAHPGNETIVTTNIPVNKTVSNNLDIMFVVDATGSMSDEILYLKTELKDVINRAGSQLPGKQIRMGSVFYRDNGDDYLTRVFNFSTSADQLNAFVNNQFAGGGGDFPEAVDEALKVSIQDQQWSTSAVNRLLFLVLDAPPHNYPNVMEKLKTAVSNAQQKGIRIIPVSASGIDFETEFLLRFLSISTNSTYTFITDHSGIGNPHHTPTVGNYDVEYLNNLMVRLITKYGQNLD